MKRLLASIVFAALVTGVSAAPLPVTPYTVIARVQSYEPFRDLNGIDRVSPAAPHGNGHVIVAVILQPAALAKREFAIPFEASPEGRELVVQKGTVFRFEHTANLTELRVRLDSVRRTLIPFPARGIIVLKPSGEVGEAYEGRLNGGK